MTNTAISGWDGFGENGVYALAQVDSSVVAWVEQR
jgi:hypothetical protein